MYSRSFSVYITAVLSAGAVNAANLGQWGPSINFPLVPVAAAVLHDTGDLLLWSAYSDNAFQVGKSGMTQTAVYNPFSGAVTQVTVTNTDHDMFCPGISTLFDGRIVVTGGDTAPRTSIYTSNGNSWFSAPNMTIGRGYQASATVSDGRVFTIGGSWSGGYGNKNGEIYSATTNTWTALPGCPEKPMLTNDKDGIFRQDSHAWLFAWKDGNVFQAGPSKAMNWYSTKGTGGQTAAGLRGADGDSMTGDAVMYDAVAGKILTVGGSPSYQDTSATSNAHVITIGAPWVNPQVATINSMWFARAYANGVVLPDGKVLILGGQTYAKPFTDTNAILTPELWDPATTKFYKMAPHTTPRNYHSVAVLMPDATVFHGGGGLCGSCSTNHFDGQFYSPPYLFLADGKTKAPRPVINNLSAWTIRVGGSVTITMAGAVKSFSLIRMGTATHTVNTDQRRIPLTPTVNGLQYTVTIPGDAGIALPGYWMLFAVDANGVPSYSKTIQVTL